LLYIALEGMLKDTELILVSGIIAQSVFQPWKEYQSIKQLVNKMSVLHVPQCPQLVRSELTRRMDPFWQN